MGGVELLTDDSKRDLLIETAKAHGLHTLVESGTYTGDTIAALLPHMDKIISIELSPEHHKNAVERFHTSKVHLVFGDSGALMPNLLKTFEGPALFWLDAHLSGVDSVGSHADNPLRRELQAIFENPAPESVVLIDDARFFGTSGWCSLDEIKLIVGPTWQVTLIDDVVRIEKGP